VEGQLSHIIFGVYIRRDTGVVFLTYFGGHRLDLANQFDVMGGLCNHCIGYSLPPAVFDQTP